MRIGVIGLGQMGSGIAANLLKAGHQVTVYNRTPGRADPLVAQGASRAATIADACRGDAALTMLANDDAVSSTVFAADGLLSSLGTGTIHISSSTISVALCERLTLGHQEKGQGFVAAPVLGRPEMAAAGKLFVIAAGAPERIAACEPLFQAIGQRSFVMGTAPKDASIVKLSANFLIASVIESLGEAIALVGKAGIDRHRFVEVLTATLFTAPVYRTYGDLIVGDQFSPAGFAAELGHKDIRLALAAAEDLRVPMPLASLLRDRFLALLAQGGALLDWSAIGQLAAIDSGQTTLNKGGKAGTLGL
jgi:3-hydroxyisobutyrate dehydrogenase-like beta-hydroxyacid dehydrogenase